MEYRYQGESIECAQADIISKRIFPTAILNIPKIGVCRKYTCKRNSEAFIIKELAPNEKKNLYKETSHLNLGDNLQAEEIFILIKSTKTLDKDVCPYTGRHNVQFMASKYYTFAEITMQFPNISKIEKQKQLDGQKNIPKLGSKKKKK